MTTEIGIKTQRIDSSPALHPRRDVLQGLPPLVPQCLHPILPLQEPDTDRRRCDHADEAHRYPQPLRPAEPLARLPVCSRTRCVQRPRLHGKYVGLHVCVRACVRE